VQLPFFLMCCFLYALVNDWNIAYLVEPEKLLVEFGLPPPDAAERFVAALATLLCVSLLSWWSLAIRLLKRCAAVVPPPNMPRIR
jgi:hypothetical protein